MDDDRTRVSDATRRAEEDEAQAPHGADRPASAEEEALVAGREVDEEVRTHYREMTEIGAHQAGEGRTP